MFSESREPQILERLSALRDKGLVDPRADLPSVAHALSTLSFGLAFSDQLVFGRKTRLLTRTVRAIAQTIAKGLVPVR